jgi:SAM-dependent methyltransferase
LVVNTCYGQAEPGCRSLLRVRYVPTAEWNLRTWAKYDWAKQGEEWSEAWGGSEAQWFGAILPRIHAYVPAGTILEIAPGFGRWTHYLRNWCERLIVVDLADNCINACRQRFASDARITYHVNDGRSLEMIPDRSIDFTFSFDSLVHADADVLQAYLHQLARKLTPNGVGFFHHSNIGEYQRSFALFDRLPPEWRRRLLVWGLVDATHNRSFTVTSAVFAMSCAQAGLHCVSQEIVNWGTRRMIDCFSVFTLKTSALARPNEIVRNPDFMKDAQAIRRLSSLYTARSL